MDFSHLHVRFYQDTKENKRESAEKGRPIFDDIEMVEIRIAGDPKSVLVAPAHSASSIRDGSTNLRLTYAQVHSDPYKAFKEGVEYIGSGTPISELSFITKAKAEELKRLNIHTAEALAGLDGTNLERLGIHGRELKNKAEAYLATAAGTADFTKLSGENAALKEQMAALQAQMELIQGGKSETEQETEQAESPFASWQDEDIVNWIEANGGPKPHHKSNHDTIVAKADEWNAELEKQSEAA